MDNVLRNFPLYQNQFAYQVGKSTETALHRVTIQSENVTEHKEIALGAFHDLEGALYITSSEAISKTTNQHGVEPTICRRITFMLESRSVAATLSGETLIFKDGG
jgi:hypothetical protein